MTSSLGTVLGAASGATTGHSWVDIGTFAVAAAIVLSGAIGVVVARNPVHSALMLVMTLFGVAVLFVLESAPFLAAVQVIVYAGAIVVLFLFVIMFLGVDREENVAFEPLRGQRPLAVGLVVLGTTGLLLLGEVSRWTTGAPHVAGLNSGSQSSNVAAARPVRVHHLPVPLRGDGCPAGHRRGRRGGAGPEAPGDGRAPGGRATRRQPRHSRGGRGPRRSRSHRRRDGATGVEPHRAGGVPAQRRGPTVTINPDWYLSLSVILFAIGALGVLVRRNVLVMFMCVELMLNAANLAFVTFARTLHDIGGQVLVFFVLVVAAAEVVVGLGIVVAIFRRRATAAADDLHVMKG